MGAQKKPKAWVLKGKKMKCPKCGGTENLSRNECVLVNTYIVVDKNGNWDWDPDRSGRVAWDSCDYTPVHGEVEWHCYDCDTDFNAPNAKPVEPMKEVVHG